jgi:hypothetical protein
VRCAANAGLKWLFFSRFENDILPVSSSGGTAEPQNTELQNHEGKTALPDGRLRHSEFGVRYSAVRSGHA